MEPARAWFLSAGDGTILSAHCSCTAGLGESCSHVAALLFAVEFHSSRLEETSPTDMSNQWIVPNAVHAVTMNSIKNIDFETPVSKAKRSRHQCQDNEPDQENVPVPPKKTNVKKYKQDIPEPSEEVQSSFLRKLTTLCAASYPRPAAILTISDGISSTVCKRPQYPLYLRRLYEEKNLRKSVDELQEMGSLVDVSVTEEQCRQLETDTRKQAKCSLWYQMRAGRITASNFKRVCRTSLNKPAMSLLNVICYPEKMKFFSEATQYGCDHEDKARWSYYQKMRLEHENFSVTPAGLFVHPDFPFMGASPDGLVQCDCCGEGLLEIKCPYCVKDCADKEEFLAKVSYLKSVCGNDHHLDTNHAYYYQNQCALAVAKKDYIDFVVWNRSVFFSERMRRDENFWRANFPRCEAYHKKFVMPELLGKAWTRPETKQVCPSIEVSTALPGIARKNPTTPVPPIVRASTLLAKTSSCPAAAVRTTFVQCPSLPPSALPGNRRVVQAADERFPDNPQRGLVLQEKDPRPHFRVPLAVLNQNVPSSLPKNTASSAHTVTRPLTPDSTSRAPTAPLLRCNASFNQISEKISGHVVPLQARTPVSSLVALTGTGPAVPRPSAHASMNECQRAATVFPSGFKNLRMASSFPALPEEDHGDARRMLNSQPNDLIVRYGGFAVYGIDVHTLRDAEEVNDVIVNTYLKLLVGRSQQGRGLPSIHCFDSLFYPDLRSVGYDAAMEKWCRQVNVFDFDIVLLPIYIRGMRHWALVTVEMRSSTVTYYDSMHVDNNECVNVIVNFLQRESLAAKLPLRKWVTKIPKDVPKQLNSYDCGVFLCLSAEAVCRREKPRCTQDDVYATIMRKRLLLDIAACRIFYSSTSSTSDKENYLPETIGTVRKGSATRRILGTVSNVQ